jgi:phage shock protein PspC (stress-responsive transcriptional regulator)
MKKIININLSGRVIPIEDAAYDSLQRYIESLRRYFAREEGRDEIINDIESRVAELMNDKIRKGAACVTEYDIEEIISAMGRVEDFEAAEGETATTAADAAAGAGYTPNFTYGEQGSRQRFKGRLYRDANDKILGGVCGGIAAYMNVDPTVVRLLFAIITFGGFGLGFLLYILLWIILPASRVESYSGKRFFRNPDDRVLGGVAGGLAAYFNKNAWTIRAIFAAPVLLKILVNILHVIFSPFDTDLPWDIATGSLTGTFIVAYIVLWIVLPEAKTPYDKMEMRGEKVDVNRIRQNVQEGMETFGARAKTWGEEVKNVGQRVTARAQEFTRTQGADFAADFRQTTRPVATGIGHAIGVVFKVIFLFVAGVAAFLLFVLLLVFMFGGLVQPIHDFFIDGIWQKVYMWGTIILFVAVPLIGIITWIIRRTMNVRSQNRYIGWVFGGLWTLGWVSLALFVTSIVKDFRRTEQVASEIALSRPSMSKMVVKVAGDPILYSGSIGWLDIDGGEGWDLTDDSLKLSNVRIVVDKSDDSLYHVTVRRLSDGGSRASALQRAERMEYAVSSMDSVLVLANGFGIGKDDTYRDQRVMVEIKIPVGKQIRFDNSVAQKFEPYDIRVTDSERTGRRRSWERRRWEVEWENNWYDDWQPDTDYYMTADGKLKEAGRPETELPGEPATPVDSIRTEQTGLPAGSDAEEAQYSMVLPATQTVKRKETENQNATPMAMPFIPAIF